MVDVSMKLPPGSAPPPPPPSLARGQGVALWRQILGQVEAEITGGALPPGARLPTEGALSARFRVTRHTVRRAMEDLQSRGLVRIEQGRGSFVAEDVLDYPLGPRTRFSETIRRQNREPRGRILRLAEVAAEPAVAEALGLGRGQASITVALAGCGVPDYRRAWTRVTTRLPGAEEAELLQQARSRPI